MSTVSIDLPPELVERLDAVRPDLPFSPSRSRLIRTAIEAWLDAHAGGLTTAAREHLAEHRRLSGLENDQ